MKLGKKAPIFDPKTPMLAHYMKPLYMQPRQSNYWGARSGRMGWTMSLNDQLGDCVVAAMDHAIDEWTVDAGKQVVISDSTTEQVYSAISGYVPGDPSTDNGCVEIEALRYWKNTGVEGHQIDGWAAIEPQNIQHVKFGIDWFGGVFVGAAMPITCDPDRYPKSKEIWAVIPNNPDAQPGSWGGHAVWAVGYDQNWIGIITWGQMVWATWPWWTAYVDEAYALVSKDWIAVTGKSPSGLNLAGLEQAIKEL